MPWRAPRRGAGRKSRGVVGLLCAALAVAPAGAQSVSMSGSLGDKAVLVIDGSPRIVATGSTVQGVKLIHVTGADAVVEIQGKRATLALGGAQVSIGGADSGAGATQIVLSASSGGHFLTAGAINGKAVRFVVDTGATYVSIGSNDAERLGLAYRGGPRGYATTANGQMAAYKIMLDSVRIGDVVVYNVEALVGAAPMDQILLGNSFLSRFQMKRENDLMTLNKRF